MVTHRYLMSVPKYFGGDFRFEVEAFNKTHAMEMAHRYIADHVDRDNFMRDYLVCVRKLKPSFGEKYEAKMHSMM